MALIDAPQAGTGKGLLVECIHIKTTGMPAVMKPAPPRDDESEWRKNLTATIERGRTLAVFDNIETVLDSSSLALALTATSSEDRILGKSENTAPLPQRLVFRHDRQQSRIGWRSATALLLDSIGRSMLRTMAEPGIPTSGFEGLGAEKPGAASGSLADARTSLVCSGPSSCADSDSWFFRRLVQDRRGHLRVRWDIRVSGKLG